MSAPHSNSPPGSSSLRLQAIGLAIAVGAVGLYFVGRAPRVHQQRTVAEDTRELSIPTVAVVSAAPGKASPGLTLPAEVKPFIEAPIHARASGYLKRWHADLGSEVREGDLLAEIDTPELDQDLVRNRAEEAQAEAALALARTTAARWSDLLKTASVSEQEAAEKQADLALRKAALDAVKANGARLKELKAFARITAPFSGVISARLVDVGDLVNAAGGKELFRLAQVNTLRVFVHLPQATAGQVKPGQTALLSTPENRGKEVAVKVVRTAGVINPETRTLLVELELDNAKRDWVAGSFAQARFPETHLDPKLTLPANTLLFRPEGPQVGIVDASGTVRLQSLSLGRDFGAYLEVLSGVTPTDRVIMNPSDSLANGSRVRIASSKPAATNAPSSKP